MKHTYPVKACPWCGKTGSFRMDCSDETWTPHIECQKSSCPVGPKSRHVPIRKAQRFDAEKIKAKVERAIGLWNGGNLPFNHEGFELDFDQIVKDFKVDRLGLPGYRQESVPSN